MPTVQVPLFSPVYRNSNGVELTDDSYELMDGYLSEKGYTVSRPGLLERVDLGQGGAPVDGLFWWPQKKSMLAVCNNKIFRVENAGGTLVATDYTAVSGPGTFSRPVFSIGVDSNIVNPTYHGFICAGANILHASGLGVALSAFSLLADTDAPTFVSHVDFIDGYTLGTTGKGYFQFSDLNSPTSWAAASFASAMRNPDDIIALKVFARQIFLFGNSTTEIWENDGVNPFAPTAGGFLQTGIIAPHSVVADSNSLYWLDSSRRFASYSNGLLTQLATPYDAEIQRFGAVADCYGIRIEIAGVPLLLFQFPAQQRTLVYNTRGRNWCEWGSWDLTNARYLHWLGSSYAYSPEWGKHLVGGRDGSIHEMSEDYYSDNGEPIRLKRVTGHLDHGTTARKRSRELRIRIRRGEGPTASDSPKLAIRWNDDNRGWSNQKFVDLGKVGDRQMPIKIFPHGIYKTRQYEIVMSDAVPVTFGGAEEDIDVLR